LTPDRERSPLLITVRAKLCDRVDYDLLESALDLHERLIGGRKGNKLWWVDRGSHIADAKQEEPVSDLVFIAFDSEQKAEEVRNKILDMQKEYLIEVKDAVIATRDANGKINLQQLANTTAQGALSGALWGC
jgi:hypothetical protein